MFIFKLLSLVLNVPFKIYVINRHYRFKHHCYLCKCSFCFWVVSLSDIVWQQITLCKNNIKRKGTSFYWLWVCYTELFCLFVPGFFNFINQREPNLLISLPWHFHCSYSFITLLFFLKKRTLSSLFSEISLLVPSLFSLPFSRLCVWRTLLETSDQEGTLELAENLLFSSEWWKLFVLEQLVMKDTSGFLIWNNRKYRDTFFSFHELQKDAYFM